MSDVEFQKKSVENILSYYKKDNANGRFLLADEVGLGKTVVARNAFEKMITDKMVDKGYYVCGSLALAEENLRKLRPESLKFSADYRNLGSFMSKYSPVCRDQVTSLLGKCDRLSLGFIQDIYNKKLRNVMIINKFYALCLRLCMDGKLAEFQKYIINENNIINDKNGIRFNKIKYGYPESLKTQPRLYFCLYGGIYNELSTVFFRSDKNIEKSKGRNNEVILKLYELLEGINIDQSVIEKIKGLLGGENKDNICKELKAIEEYYNLIVKIKDIPLVSLTPTTSVFFTSEGSKEEKALIKIVLNKIYDSKLKNVPNLYNAILNFPGNDTASWDSFISELIDASVYTEIEKLANDTPCDIFYSKKGKEDDAIGQYFVSCNDKSREQMKISDIFSENILTKLENDPEMIGKYCRHIYIAMRKLLSIYTINGATGTDSLKNFVIVDEFQNYSDILNGNSNSSSGVVAEALLRKSEKNYVLLLSATPFRYSTRSCRLDEGLEDAADESQKGDSISGSPMIDEEVESVLRYVLEDEVYKEWLAINADRRRAIENITTANDFEEVKRFTRCQEKLLFENGVSRVERKNVEFEECMVLSTEDVKDAIFSYPTLYIGNEIAENPLDNDLVIIHTSDEYITDYFVLRKADQAWKYYECSQEYSNLILDEFENTWEFEMTELCYLKATSFDAEDEEEAEESEIFFEWITDEELFPEVKGILKKYLKKKKDIKVSERYLKDTPFLFSFAEEYTSIDTNSLDSSYRIKKEIIDNNEELVTDHARYNLLKKDLFGDNNQNTKLLFLPPSKPHYKLNGNYSGYDEGKAYSKSLIFSAYNHTPRALSSLLSYEADRLNKRDNNDKNYYNILTGTPCGYEQNDDRNLISVIKDSIIEYIEEDSFKYVEIAKKLNNKFDEELFKKHSKQIGSIAGYFVDLYCSDGGVICNDNFSVEEVAYEIIRNFREAILAIYRMFLTKEAGNIIINESGDRYIDKIHNYCASGCFRAVLDEYIFMIREAERVSENVSLPYLGKVLGEELIKVQQHQHSIIKTKDNISIRTGFAIGHYKGSAENMSDAKSLSNKLSAFNSPFRPFVFVTTSVGQEGFDFHRYCRNIVHWSLIYDPVKFEQREGRINRYHGHIIRLNIAKDYNGDLNYSYKDWNAMFSHALKSEDGMSPDWIYPEISSKQENYCTLTRKAYYNPMSRECEGYKKLKETRACYRALLGQTDIEDFAEERLMNILNGMDEEEKKQILDEIIININPFYHVK